MRKYTLVVLGTIILFSCQQKKEPKIITEWYDDAKTILKEKYFAIEIED